MKIILTKKKLVTALKNEKDLGFVPTMGSLHKGHISLINKSSNICKKTIVSIFINKTQFNQKSDYKKYPRNLKKDISILRKCNIDYLYLPTNKQIYPDGPNKTKNSPFFMVKSDFSTATKSPKVFFIFCICISDII